MDRRAIGAARQNAILDLLIGREFAGQKPANDEQQHNDAERDQRLAAGGAFALGVMFVNFWHGATIDASRKSAMSALPPKADIRSPLLYDLIRTKEE